MDNIQKNFKMKSKLRGMADGGQPPPPLPGNGMAQQAAGALRGRRSRIADVVDAASAGLPPPQQQAPVEPPPPEQPQGQPTVEGKSVWRTLLGMANGGDVQGKGGPTDDAIGPVALSDGEYVLPADTVDAVGKEKLDALRLATHDFVDPAKKQGLRGMANGGVIPPNGMDPELIKRAQAASLNEGKAFVNNTPRFGAPPVAGVAKEFAKEVSPGLMRKGLGMVGGVATGPLGKLAIYPAVAYGLGKSYMESGTDKSRAFEDSIGVETPLGAAGASMLRTAANIGDAVTGGRAGQWGRNLADTISGVPSAQKNAAPTAVDPTDAPQLATKPTAPQSVGTTSTAGPIQQVAPDSYVSRRLAEMGVPVDQQNKPSITEDASRKLLREGTGTPGQYTNLGTYGGNANIYATASKPGGRVNSFVGVGQPQANENPYLSALRAQLNGTSTESEANNRRAPADNSYEINKRYDALSDRLTSMYGGQNKGDLARRLLVLEANRSAALGTDNNAQASVYSAGLGADTQAANSKLQSRNTALQQLGALSEKEAAAQVADRKAQQDAIDKAAEQQLKAQQDARANEETGFKRYNDMIGNMFNGPDDQVNKIAREKFTSYLQGSNPKELTSLPNAPDTWEKFAEMSPTKQSMYLQNMRLLHEMGQARNEAATRGVFNEGMTTNRVAMPETVKSAEIGDVFNSHLAPADYLRSKIPYFHNPNVVVDQTGQATLLDDYASSNGAWDADKLELVRQRTGFDKDGKPVRK